MIGFSAFPYTLCPLTLDHGWLLDRMRNLHPGMLGDATGIGDAMASAINRLRDSKAKSKVVVLLTDGQNNCGLMQPDIAAQRPSARHQDLQPSAPSSHTARGAGDDAVDEGALKRIADTTGAVYFRAANLDRMQEVYGQIDKLEKTEVQVDHFTRFRELANPWLLAALLCLGLEQLLALTRLGSSHEEIDD